MPCDHVKLPNGFRAIVCSRGHRGKAWRCFCGLAGGFQCDWKVGDGKTCDVHLCPDHATTVGEDKHLCPLHAEAYERWKDERAKKAAAG